MTNKTLRIRGHEFMSIHGEVNKLRERDGHEEIGTLALAAKLVSHFQEAHNPRVAEAFANLDKAKVQPKED